MIKIVLRGIGFVLGAVLATLVLAECGVRVTGVGDRVLVDNLYYTGYDREVHRVSETPGLFYELAPGTKMQSLQGFDEHSPVPADLAPGDLDESGGRPYLVSISEHGTRGPTYPEPKAEGVFRVHFFGASTLYGAGMNNNETLAAYLQEALEDLAPSGQHIEVWNYGTSAYVLTQMALLAQRELEDHDPDLILLLHSNVGRRPFLQYSEADFYREQLVTIPELLRENFLLGCRDWGWDWTAPMAWSHAYQAIALAWLRDQMSTCPPKSEETQFRLLPELVALAQDQGVPIQFIAAAAEPAQSQESVYPSLPDALFWSLQLMEREAVFYDLHPSPRILKEHAGRLAEELGKRGLVPVSKEPQAPLPSPDDCGLEAI